jgi:KaiC/GvpD/RAD55 family RecA-like ATPase
MEEYLSHGVVILRSMKSGARVARAIVIEKMRETEIDPNPRPYKIERNGIVVFPKESVI